MAGTYRPQSPDLSGLHPQAVPGYRPQSPDLSSLDAQAANAQYSPPVQRHYLAGDFGNNQHTAPLYPKSDPYAQPQPSTFQYGMPPSRVKHEDLDYLPDATVASKESMQTPAVLPKAEYSDPTLGVVLKTSFPVARIKRIMQADEDIGKVAQVTPHVVSRALELFMIKLITASSDQARGLGGANGKGPRRVLVQHMKKAIQADEKFDFLAEIVSKVPDAPSKTKKDAGSDSEDTKPKKKSRRRKDDD